MLVLEQVSLNVFLEMMGVIFSQQVHQVVVVIKLALADTIQILLQKHAQRVWIIEVLVLGQVSQNVFLVKLGAIFKQQVRQVVVVFKLALMDTIQILLQAHAKCV